LVVLVVVAAGVSSACGGATPEPAQPALESEATATSELIEPTDVPTEPPAEAATEAPAEEPVSIDAEALLQERCTVCHGLSRTTSAKKSRVGWEQTVTGMVKRGATLNEEEQAVLIDYLAETYGQ
jgi:hypothetical protein